MANKKSAKKKATGTRRPNVNSAAADEADGVQVGEEPVPGMRLRCICRGHHGTIGRIAWSPCGRFIASPSTDKTVRIWDAEDGGCVAVLAGHLSAVHCVAWSPDGMKLASGSADSTVRVWDENLWKWPDIWKKHRTIQAYSEKVHSVSWAPDGELVAFGGSGQNVELWDVATRKIDIRLGARDQRVDSLAWSLDGELLAIGLLDRIEFWGPVLNWAVPLRGHSDRLLCLCWHPKFKNVIASCSRDSQIRIWHVATSSLRHILEGHTSSVSSIAFSPDGKLLASKGMHEEIRLWSVDTWTAIASLKESANGTTYYAGLDFHPSENVLATLGEQDKSIRLWDIDVDTLIPSPSNLRPHGRATIATRPVRYTSAKVVLVGESNVGKSCLAMRLAEDRYPADHEHGTTHGMRFWPMEAEALHPSAKPPDGQRRDVVLWDFGGQDEYQLVHQMFLHDTTLALVLIDPTRGRAAIDEARDWNKRLEIHLGKDRAVKLLVGAKVDKKRDLIDRNSIDALCKECGFGGFLDVSARTGRNTKKLRKLISDALDWGQMAKTSRPELFQRIRDDIEKSRKEGEVVRLLDDLTDSLTPEIYDVQMIELGHHDPPNLQDQNLRAVAAVTDQLAAQGIIVKTQLMTGDEALVLQLPVIECYAGSLIIAARNNPRGVPVLEERLLGSTKTIPLLGMTKKGRLSPAKERMVMECIVELMIQHGICFRHGGLLVFPTLFPSSGSNDETLPHSVSLYYDFTGAIDYIYASLVSKLMVSEEFGEGRLNSECVEFERGRQGVCGIRQIKRKGGLAHLDLYFSENTETKRRDLFTSFVDQHLQANGVDIREHEAMKCKCGFELTEDDIQKIIKRGKKTVNCPVCETLSPIGQSTNRIRERNPETEALMVGLRKTIDEKLAQDARAAKEIVSKGRAARKSGDPVYILHLSDLHFTKDTKPEMRLKLLLQDLRNRADDFPAIDAVEYLVISGDMTDKGNDAGFDMAREFVAALVDKLKLSTQRCIFVPGNHDVQDREDAYEEREDENGTKIRVRHQKNFEKRFERFSQVFFHPLRQENYPLEYGKQGIAYTFADTGIQFLSLNSAWQIDKNGRRKSGIHEDAIVNVIDQANADHEGLVERGDLNRDQPILRIGIWHHAACGPEQMQDVDFISQLKGADVKFCLHGDVHESRVELLGYNAPGCNLQVVGAGSFGSTAEGRPESAPKLYNLLEIEVNSRTKKHESVRVHTRQQKKDKRAWEGYYEWPNQFGTGRLPYFDFDLTD